MAMKSIAHVAEKRCFSVMPAYMQRITKVINVTGAKEKNVGGREMIKTMEIHNGIRIYLQSNFTRVPEGGYYLTLEVRNDGMARGWLAKILNNIKKDIADYYLTSIRINAPEKAKKLLEHSSAKYLELKWVENEINENDSWLYSSPDKKEEIMAREKCVRTVLLDNMMEIYLWNTFTLLPEDKPHMILRIKNKQIAEKCVMDIRSDLEFEAGFLRQERSRMDPGTKFGLILIEKSEKEYKKLTDMIYEAIPGLLI